MNRGTVIFAVLLAALGLGSCAKQSIQTTYDRQAGFIESFIRSKMAVDPTATLSKNEGSYRLTINDTLVRNGEDTLRWGGRVALHYACYVLSSASISTSNLVSTNRKEVAKAAGWSLSDSSQYKLDTLTVDKSLVDGLAKGLIGVQKKDEAFILFTGQYAFGKVERGTIPARSALVYQVWIDKIDNE